MTIGIEALVWASVALELLSCLGLVLASTHFDRLHYASAAAVTPLILLAAAVGLSEGVSTQLWNAVAVAAMLVLLNGLLTHATGRAARKRDYGGVAALPEERNA